MMEVIRAMYRLLLAAHYHNRDCKPFAQLLVDELIDQYQLTRPNPVTVEPDKLPLDSELVHSAMRVVHDSMRTRSCTGTKVTMIKLCRALTGLGLKESKDFIESHGYYT